MAHPLCLVYLYGVISLSSIFFSAALALGAITPQPEER
jgi:hypothetical protein